MKMWKTCVTLALLICVQVCAHGPLYPRAAGVNAKKKAWPWMVSLHNQNGHFCGGSLINHQWVLSAAHCFIGPNYHMNEASVLVVLGMLKLDKINKKKKMRNVQRIYIHDLYNHTTDDGDNDIALLHLSSQVDFDDYISPLCLVAHGSDFPAGTSSRLIGWGQTAPGVDLAYPGTLQEAEILVEDYNQCHNQLMTHINRLNNPIKRTNKTFTNNMICARSSAGVAATYCGDSGGPMMSEYCSKWVQSGITSWGFNCSSNILPGVYTRVSQYKEWITVTISPHSSQDLPTFVNVNLPCPPVTGTQGKKGCCCM